MLLQPLWFDGSMLSPPFAVLGIDCPGQHGFTGRICESCSPHIENHHHHSKKEILGGSRDGIALQYDHTQGLTVAWHYIFILSP